MDIMFFLQLILSGLLIGGIYALLALGVVLIVKASGVFNFAQGDMTALGAFAAWGIITFFTDMGLGALAIPGMIVGIIILSIIVAFIIEHFALQPLIGQPMIAALMLTVSLGMVISGIVSMAWPGPGRVFPPMIPTGSVKLGSISLSTGGLVSFIICMAIFGLFVLFFQKTKLGLAMRGTSEDQQLSQSVGIKVTVIFLACWFIAMLLATASGVLVGSMQVLDRTTLAAFGGMAFPAVLLGGLESIPGALIGGLIIGVVEMLAGGYLDPYLGGGVGAVMPYIVMLIILIFMPYGLFGYKRIERV
jgi:branched-chain amino acid transport system permease protein